MVTRIEEFKTAKAAKAKPLVSRRRAALAAGTLLDVLSRSEASDILATMRFDLAPADMQSIECFVFHLQSRIEDHLNGYSKRTEGIDLQPAS